MHRLIAQLRWPRRAARPAPLLIAPLIALSIVAACDPTAPPATHAAALTDSSPATPFAASSSPSPSPSIWPSPTLAAITPRPEPTFLAYLVAPGDTLTSIARRNATTARSIAFWNRATYPSLDPESASYEPDRVEVGWKLVLIPGTVVDEAEPLPGSSPTPRPTLNIPPAPTPRPDGSSLLVSHGSRESNVVALTFELGSRLDPALSIVQWLVDHDVHATIFAPGRTATDTASGKAIMALIAAHPDLFSLGNEAWDDPDLTKRDASGIADQLARGEAAVESTTGRSTKPFFRPPSGLHDEAVRSVAGSGGWAYTIMWDVDSVDWKATSDGGPTTADIEAKVLSRVQGGSIVRLSLGGYHTLEALPGIIEGFGERRLEPVTLGEMFGR